MSDPASSSAGVSAPASSSKAGRHRKVPGASSSASRAKFIDPESRGGVDNATFFSARMSYGELFTHGAEIRSAPELFSFFFTLLTKLSSHLSFLRRRSVVLCLLGFCVAFLAFDILFSIWVVLSYQHHAYNYMLTPFDPNALARPPAAPLSALSLHTADGPAGDYCAFPAADAAGKVARCSSVLPEWEDSGVTENWRRLSPESVGYLDVWQRPRALLVMGPLASAKWGRYELRSEALFQFIESNHDLLYAEAQQKWSWIEFSAMEPLWTEGAGYVGRALATSRTGMCASTAARFPVVAELLESTAKFELGLNMMELDVFVSFLHKGTHVARHFGLTNARVRCQMPLSPVPPEAHLRVYDSEVAWKQGSVVCFDDSFDHEMWNLSGETMVLLEFFAWHPQLTKGQVQAIANALPSVSVGVGMEPAATC